MGLTLRRRERCDASSHHPEYGIWYMHRELQGPLGRPEHSTTRINGKAEQQ